jgi:hypothetical protein
MKVIPIGKICSLVQEGIIVLKDRNATKEWDCAAPERIILTDKQRMRRLHSSSQNPSGIGLLWPFLEVHADARACLTEANTSPFDQSDIDRIGMKGIQRNRHKYKRELRNFICFRQLIISRNNVLGGY